MRTKQASALHTLFIPLFCGIALSGCSLGPTELMLILGIVVVLFGATRLPQLGKALGDTVKSFKEAQAKDELDEKSASAQKAPDADIEADNEKKS